MGRKLTLEIIKNFIEVESNSGCKLLSGEYDGYDVPLLLIGKCGHQYNVSFHSFKNMERYTCISCSMENSARLRRTDIDDIRKELSEKGCELLSEFYKSAKHPLKIKFACGHISERCISDFRMSRPFCRECNPSCQLTYEYVIEYMKENGYIFLEKEWVTTKKQINFKDKIGYKYFITFGAFRNIIKRNGKPEKFGIGNPYTMPNLKLWIKENKMNYSFVSGTFKSCSDKTLTFKCKKCKKDWITCIDFLLNHSTKSCPECAVKEAGERASASHVKAKGSFIISNPELEKEYDKVKNKKSALCYTTQCNTKVWWLCPKCGCSYDARIQDRTIKRSGCPDCSSSRGEVRVAQFLNKNNIKMKPEYKFDDCKYKRKLPFDFYLFDYQCCIEFHGPHHYRAVDFSNNKNKNKEKAEAQFELVKLRDKIKTDYCRNNNIPLIIIPYTEFNNIESILTYELGL